MRVGERDIALYHLAGGEYRATDNVCTHEYASSPRAGSKAGDDRVPAARGQFDVRTGKALCAPVEKDVETFEVRVAGADLEVKLPG